MYNCIILVAAKLVYFFQCSGGVEQRHVLITLIHGQKMKSFGSSIFPVITVLKTK